MKAKYEKPSIEVIEMAPENILISTSANDVDGDFIMNGGLTLEFNIFSGD
ncbi:MAG: hypothetical protein K5683_10220 [Prevotella sp.]|nr:hypothetical protein [Prevotella sp.]